MISYFSKKNNTSFLVLFIYTIVLKSNFFIQPNVALMTVSDGWLYKFIVKQFAIFGSYQNLYLSIFAVLLLFHQAFAISKIFIKLKLFNTPNYLVGMSYLLITSMFANWNVLCSALVINSILIYVWQQIEHLQNTNSSKTILFNIGIMLCIANFIYTFTFVFLILALIGILTYRTFKLNEYFVLFMGYLLPYYFLFVCLYLTNNFNLTDFKLWVHYSLPKMFLLKWNIISISLAILLLFTGLFFIQEKSSKMSIQVRKTWSILFFWVIISCLIPFVNADFRYFIICSLPSATFIAASFFYIKNKNLKIVLHGLLFMVAIFVSYILK